MCSSGGTAAITPLANTNIETDTGRATSFCRPPVRREYMPHACRPAYLPAFVRMEQFSGAYGPPCMRTGERFGALSFFTEMLPLRSFSVPPPISKTAVSG